MHVQCGITHATVSKSPQAIVVILLGRFFEESKQTIVDEVKNGVRIFDKSKPTCPATDWSKLGIGYWLFQKHCSCGGVKPFCCPTGWKVVLVGSRFPSPAESNYGPIEGEALAVTYSIDKEKHFVLGCDDRTKEVDHKPLLGFFSNRSLHDIPNSVSSQSERKDPA
eukprot:TCONS_00040375-protein